EKECGDVSAASALARQTADQFAKFCDARPDDAEALSLAGHYISVIAPPLRHAGAPDEALRVADRCLRLLEGLTRTHPDEPRQGMGLSEAWTQRAKTLWTLGRLEETERALRAALRVADDLAKRWPELRELRDERRRRMGRFLEE